MADEIKIPGAGGDGGELEAAVTKQEVSVKLLLSISIGSDGRIYVQGPLENKNLCINALADATKAVINLVDAESPIVKPNLPGGILNFMRGKR